jgi:hypothetical protein
MGGVWREIQPQRHRGTERGGLDHPQMTQRDAEVEARLFTDFPGAHTLSCIEGPALAGSIRRDRSSCKRGGSPARRGENGTQFGLMGLPPALRTGRTGSAQDPGLGQEPDQRVRRRAGRCIMAEHGPAAESGEVIWEMSVEEDLSLTRITCRDNSRGGEQVMDASGLMRSSLRRPRESSTGRDTNSAAFAGQSTHYWASR